MMDESHGYRAQLEFAHKNILSSLDKLDQVPLSEFDVLVLESAQCRLYQKLAQIENALCRLRRNKFGICLACHMSISAERLRILPHAKLCFSCQRQRERKEGGMLCMGW